MELTDLTKPLVNKVKPVPFDEFQRSADWIVPRGRVYYKPVGSYIKGTVKFVTFRFSSLTGNPVNHVI